MTMSIKEFIEKSKCFPHKNKDIFIVIILILVAFGSFGLGRLSKIEELKSPVSIENMSASVVEAGVEPVLSSNKEALPSPPQEGLPAARLRATRGQAPAAQAGGFYVGSKNGSKYHFPWCPGAKRIKEENKVMFETKEEAEKTGYTPAENCKGLR